MSWLSLFLFLIMGGICYFQAIQGGFSALIMAVICVLCATLSFGVHEVIAENMLMSFLGDYAYPVAFVGLFGIGVLILRLVLDKFISRAAPMPLLFDRVTAIFCGLITALICTGVMGTGIQMIPWGPSILGFQRIDPQGRENDLWLSPDKFTVNLCGYLSSATLSAENSWQAYHPDFLRELHWLRNTDALGSRISVPPGTVEIIKLSQVDQLYIYKPGQERGRGAELTAAPGPGSGNIWLVVSVRLSPEAKDPDGKFRFSGTQVRVVGEVENRTIQTTLKGLGPFDGYYVTADSQPLWGNDTGEFDFVFEVPSAFRLRFIEYKRSGRRSLMNSRVADSLQLRETIPPPAGVVAEPQQQRPRRSGRATTPIRPKKIDSHFGSGLPLTIKRYSGTSVSVQGEGELAAGQLVLSVDKQESTGRDAASEPEGTHITSFSVPPGLRMLQLSVEAVQAKTTLAGIVNLTRRVLRQYHIVDSKGEVYWPAGLIAECDYRGERIMEIQYFPEEPTEQLRTAIRPFQRFSHENLTGDYQFVLLFVLPPGTEVVTFDAGQSKVDISDMNLVAPQ